MDQIRKKQLISSLKDGDSVNDVFFVKFKKGVQEYKNGYSFELVLSDSSNKNISCKFWGTSNENEVREIYSKIREDSIVKIISKAKLFNGRLQISVNNPGEIRVLEKGEYVESDFIALSKKDPVEMFSRIISEIEKVENEKLKAMLKGIFNDPKIMEQYKIHPGAIEVHHNWISGLMQHSLEVLEYCKKSKELFDELDYDLLVAGSLLHDIGKLEEIEMTSRIKGTKKGQLSSHLVLSSIFISKKCEEYAVCEEIKDKLVHLAVSHHGKLEYGSPKQPMFPEAVALYYADELSSKISEMINFIKSTKKTTENEFGFHKRYQRNILLK